MIQNQPGPEGPRDTDRGTVPPDGRPLADQPKWRRDFPIDWAEDEYVARRELVKFMVLTSAAFVAGQFGILLESLSGTRGAAAPVGVGAGPLDEHGLVGSLDITLYRDDLARIVDRD